MLRTIVILFVLWTLGLATSYTLGGFVHLLLLLAWVAILINLFHGRISGHLSWTKEAMKK